MGVLLIGVGLGLIAALCVGFAGAGLGLVLLTYAGAGTLGVGLGALILIGWGRRPPPGLQPALVTPGP